MKSLLEAIMKLKAIWKKLNSSHYKSVKPSHPYDLYLTLALLSKGHNFFFLLDFCLYSIDPSGDAERKCGKRHTAEVAGQN